MATWEADIAEMQAQVTWASRKAREAASGPLFDDDCSRGEMARGILAAIRETTERCHIAVDTTPYSLADREFRAAALASIRKLGEP